MMQAAVWSAGLQGVAQGQGDRTLGKCLLDQWRQWHFPSAICREHEGDKIGLLRAMGMASQVPLCLGSALWASADRLPSTPAWFIIPRVF